MYHDRIINLVVDSKRLTDFNLKIKQGKLNLHRLQFTRDNYVKLALIYFRIKSK